MAQISKLTILWIFACCQLCSCIDPGTHGSIGKYCYPVKHEALRYSIDRIIEDDNDVIENRDTTKRYINVLRDDGISDSILHQHPNSHAYVDIRIIHDINLFTYRIHYIGSQKDWDTSQTSCLSIAYAFDSDGRGGSEGDGGVNKSSTLKKQLKDLFEHEVIARVDSALGVDHESPR